jgi:ABC-type branched-subunit amino acid transport system ATPase component
MEATVAFQLNLQVERQNIFGFLGPNGAGKTTTVRRLMDMVRPASGTASLLGMDARRDSVAIKRKVALCRRRAVRTRRGVCENRDDACIMTTMGKRAQRKRAERDKQRIRVLPDLPSIEPVTGSVATLREGSDRTSLDEAQVLIYEAFESDARTRVKLARRALAISADCADAYTILAEEMARTYAEKRDFYAAGVAAGERALGPEPFEQDVGAFWGLIETRPYMRARAGLATCLWHLGERTEAVGHFRDLLRLNPNDNQGIRFTLVSCLMALGRDAEAQTLLDHPEYLDDGSASWAYARALLAFRREGAGPQARQLLAEALEINRFVPAYLTGQKPLPRRMPLMIGPGEASEAVECAAEQLEAWGRTSGAVGWLQAGTSHGRSRQPTRRVAVTSASRRDVAERRRWLFPPVTGSFDGIELVFLDPANPDDRHLLIMAEHPDYRRVIEEGRDEVEVDGSVVNPRLHLAYHEAVANQLWDGTPPEAWPTVERLGRLGYGRHDILHMLGSVLTEQLRQALEKREPNDPKKYARALAALPESWQED